MSKALEKEPLYWSVTDGWVYEDDTSQERVDETTKCKHEWVGLTDEERREIFDACETTDRGYVLAMCEAKLREKNHG